MSTHQTLHKSKRKAGQVTFNRNELRILLNEYSRRVAAGEWRDYAMDFTRDRAVFSVFRHTAEHPLYSIEKSPGKSGRTPLYAVSRGPQRLKQSENLDTVLDAIKRKPRLRTVG
jgi:hypothetical protein